MGGWIIPCEFTADGLPVDFPGRGPKPGGGRIAGWLPLFGKELSFPLQLLVIALAESRLLDVGYFPNSGLADNSDALNGGRELDTSGPSPPRGLCDESPLLYKLGSNCELQSDVCTSPWFESPRT